MVMEKITFGKDNLPGYVVGDVKNPAILVIQEWWGVNDLIKAQAEKIAAQGYRCLIPDVYHGKIGIDKEEASHLLSKLDWVRAVEEIKEAVAFLRADGAEKIGAIGFCMGGALALAAAQHAGIQAAQPFYGTPSTELCQPENIKVPVQLHAGALDDMKGFSDAETLKSWADKINAAGGDAVFHVYENCGHSFLNFGDEAIAKRDHMGFPHPPPAQQELAWKHVFEFFEKHLKN